MLKENIRKKLLRMRQNQPEEERKEKSSIIWKKLKVLPQFLKARTVMFYLSLPDEVDTEVMVKESLEIGKRIVVPITQLDKKKMKLSVLRDYDKELGPGTFNIPEPRKEYVRKISPSDIDLVIVPGIAFDEKCGRLGFGKGFYDHFLKDLAGSVSSIALAYDFQILRKLPLEKYDVLVSRIITEKRIIERKGD